MYPLFSLFDIIVYLDTSTLRNQLWYIAINSIPVCIHIHIHIHFHYYFYWCPFYIPEYHIAFICQVSGLNSPVLCYCASVVSDSMWHYGSWPARFLCQWDSPCMNTRVGHPLLQGIFPSQGSNSCLL